MIKNEVDFLINPTKNVACTSQTTVRHNLLDQLDVSENQIATSYINDSSLNSSTTHSVLNKLNISTDPMVDTTFSTNNDFTKPISTTNLNTDIKDLIVTWAVEENISHVSLSKLLKILKSHSCLNYLPSDPRTLLKTPNKLTIVKELYPGIYHHFGLENGLNQYLKKNKEFLLNNTEIEIIISVDGLPLSKSSSNNLWPILGSIYKTSFVFLIGAFHSTESTKPKCAISFMADFVTEAKCLIQNGFQCENKKIMLKIRMLTADTPAKSFILNVKGHSGYYSCTKCCIEGEYHKGVCFPPIVAKLRNDNDFRNYSDEEYHLGECPLINIPNFDLVAQVPLDYMHLVCLGVVKKLFKLWTTDHLSVRLQVRKLCLISDRLLKHVSVFVPLEFQRKPRSLMVYKQWKATEFRQFLLYSGPVVLKDVVSIDVYNHFLSLHVAISILASNELHLKLINYAEELLRHFVISFEVLYGIHNSSHNIHGLLHLADDVKYHGTLDEFSAFKFENFMQQLKKMIRKSDKPLQQISRRYVERKNIGLFGNIKKVNRTIPCNNKNNYFNFNGFTLISHNSKNNCCILKTGEIILIKEFLFDTNSKLYGLKGKQFLEQDDLYITPCPSSLLGIYVVGKLSSISTWTICQVQKKCFRYRLPWNINKYVVFPLLHSDSDDIPDL